MPGIAISAARVAVASVRREKRRIVTSLGFDRTGCPVFFVAARLAQRQKIEKS